MEDSLSLTGRTVAGHFLVEGVVTEGRRSVIYRGRQVGPDEPVALRILKMGGSKDPSNVDAFVRKWRSESNAIAGVVLGDPQLVRIIEYGTAATGVGTFVPFAASEWLVGRSLADDVKAHGPRALKDAIKLLEPAAGALAFAHRSGVAHGSLSSHTLYIADSEDGPQMRVLDLGMWTVLAEVGKELPEAATIFVTPWAAPEHLDPSVGDVGLATDVHSLALIVLELLRGSSIVPADAAEDVIRRTVLDPSAPRTPKDMNISVGGHAERAFARALLRDPSERWPDVGVFWSALKAALADDEAGVPVTSWPEPEHDTARRIVLPPDLPDDALTPTGLTPTGLTPTGLTPTGPTNPILPAVGSKPDVVPASEPRLPDFDDGATTEMPTFSPSPPSDPRPSPGPVSNRSGSRSIVRPLDDEDLTPVQFTSSQRQRAAQRVVDSSPTAVGRSSPSDLADANIDDTDERPVYIEPTDPSPPPVVPVNGKGSERRRAAKPGDPPPEAAGSGRATGLKVTRPAPSAKVSVDDLPSVIVDDSAMPDVRAYEQSPANSFRPVGPMPHNDDEKTVVQLEPPHGAPVPAPVRLEPRTSSARPAPRASLTPQPARHYGASGRRARERRQLMLVGFVVFLAVAIATGLVLGLGAFRQ